MKKKACGVLAACLWTIGSYGQTFYFSERPFNMDEVPNATSKTNFTDESTIYGLCVIEGKKLSELTRTRDYPGFKEGFFNYRVTVKGTRLYDKRVTSTMVEKDGKIYMHMGILPNPDENIDETSRSWENIWLGMNEGANTVKIYSKEKVKFKTEITLNKSGSINEDDLENTFYKAERAATDFFNGIEDDQKAIDDAKSGLSERYIDAFARLYHPLNFQDEQLSQSSLERLVSAKRGNQVSVLKIASQRQGSDWYIKKNALGVIMHKSSPHIILVFKDEGDGWCYYRGMYVIKEYLDAGNYAAPYIRWSSAGLTHGRCGCDNLDF